MSISRYLFGAELEVEADSLQDALRTIGTAIVNAADDVENGLGPLSGSWHVSRIGSAGDTYRIDVQPRMSL